MHGLLHSLTVVALLAHLMLGCCVHHSHAAAASIDDHGCCDATHAEVAGGHECSDDRHPDYGTCKGGRCWFLRSPGTDAFFWEISPSPILVLPDTPAIADVSGAACSFSSGRLLLPVRLHLANLVLLI